MVLYGADVIPIDVHAAHQRTRRVFVLHQATGAGLQAQAGQIDARRDDALVVVGIHAHRVALEIEGEGAVLDMLELILVQVGPAPNPGVDHVRKALATGYLLIEYRMHLY